MDLYKGWNPESLSLFDTMVSLSDQFSFEAKKSLGQNKVACANHTVK